MHLVKWFRKNNRKVMIVIIFIAIVGFIGYFAIPGAVALLGLMLQPIIQPFADRAQAAKKEKARQHKLKG